MLSEELDTPITELAASDPSGWKLLPGRLTPPTLRPHAGRQKTHRMVDAFSPIMGVTCDAQYKGKRIKYTAHEGSVDCILCLAKGRRR